MSKAMVVLSFDDGRGDNTEVFENILIPAKLPVTLNVTTGYVDGTIPEELRPCPAPAMTVEEVKRLHQSGFVEMALHGDTHQNTEEDMAVCRSKLIQWLDLPENYMFGMASPKSEISIGDFANAEHGFFAEKVLYLRSGLRISSRRGLRVLSRKMGRVWHRPEFYRTAYRDTLMQECADRVIYAVPILGDITLKQVAAIVDDAAGSGKSVCLMFHSIGTPLTPGDNWTWSLEKFQNLCNFLETMRDSGKVDVVTTREMYKRLREKAELNRG